MRYTPRAPKELIDGYLQAADLAERRRAQVADADPREAKQWQKVEAHCRRMAHKAWIDSKDRISSYLYPTDPDEMAQMMARDTEREMEELITTLSGESLAPHPDVERHQRLALAAALALLTPQERVIVKLHLGGLWPLLFIAEALGITLDAAQSSLKRARKKFLEIKAQAA